MGAGAWGKTRQTRNNIVVNTCVAVMMSLKETRKGKNENPKYSQKNSCRAPRLGDVGARPPK